MNNNSIVGIISTAIYWSEEFYEKLFQKISGTLKNYKFNDLNLSNSDIIFNAVFTVYNTKYSVKVLNLQSERKYAIISGNNLCYVKVLETPKKGMIIEWNKEKYTVLYDKVAIKFSVTVNNHNLCITKNKDISGSVSYLQFPVINDQYEDDLSLFYDCFSNLESVLKGYNLPEPFFTNNLTTSLEKLFKTLQNPILPCLKYQKNLRELVNHNPKLNPLVQEIKQLLLIYTSNSSSLFSKFPADQIHNTIENYLNHISDRIERVELAREMQSIEELTELYNGGLRRCAKSIIQKLLILYHKVETKFNINSNDCSLEFPDDLIILNPETEEDESNNSTLITCEDIISHANLKYKNRLIINLIDYTERLFPGVIMDLKPILYKMINGLSNNNNCNIPSNDYKGYSSESDESIDEMFSCRKKYGKVLSKLRQVTSACHIQSYEIRKNQIEAILLSNNSSKIESLIYSNSEFFDIISDFFYHPNKNVSKCALEIYVRRSYSAYRIESFQQFELKSGNKGVVYKFICESNSNQKNSGLKRSNSVINIGHNQNISFRKFSALEKIHNNNNWEENIKTPTGDYCIDDKGLSRMKQHPLSNNINPSKVSNTSKSNNGPNNLSNDNDNDSAISVGAPSLSDENDYGGCLLDRNSSSSSSLENTTNQNNCNEANSSKAIKSQISNEDSIYPSLGSIDSGNNFAISSSIHSLNKIDQIKTYLPNKYIGGTNKIGANKTIFGLDHIHHSSNSSLTFDSDKRRNSCAFIDKNLDFTIESWYSFNSISTEMGITVIFTTFDELIENISLLFEVISNGGSSFKNTISYSSSIYDSESEKVDVVSLNIILNDASIIKGTFSDDEIAELFHKFSSDHSEDFHSLKVHRITFLLKTIEKDIRFFTYMSTQKDYVEDILFRQIDPALSDQLEIDRLRNYKLERLTVPNRRMYVCLGECTNNQANHSIYRLFVRCIIHHTDLSNSTSSLETVARQAEHSLFEAMEAVEIVCTDERVNLSESNHLFFCFQSILCLDKLEDLESVVRKIVLKYGRRLWNCRITQAELKMTIHLRNQQGTYNAIPIRMWVHNEGGRSLEICTYREEINKSLGNTKVLVTLTNSSTDLLNNTHISRIGRYHGLQVHCFYSL